MKDQPVVPDSATPPPPAASNGVYGSPPQPEAPATKPKEPIYKKKWFLPVAMLVIGMVLGVAMTAGSSEGSSGGDDIATLKSKVATLESQLDAVTTDRDALKAAATTPSEPAPEPEPAAAPSLDAQKAGFVAAFEESRVKLAGIVEDDGNAESVDKLAYDAKTETVILDVTSRWGSPDNQVDGAWAIVRLMSTLYDADEGAWYQDGFVPNLRLVNSGRKYTQSGDFMLRLAAFSASRSDWEKECW
ncbi:MAG: hypothetical protein Q8K99_05645 [Actinomycetota bacterium]|nr:hypothetical protein [Actinomycetota bacterium]